NPPVIPSFPTRRSSDLAVQQEHPDRLEALEDELFGAMFRELRDVSDPAELRKCGEAAAVPDGSVDRALSDPALRDGVFAEHQERSEEHTSELQSPYDLV